MGRRKIARHCRVCASIASSRTIFCMWPKKKLNFRSLKKVSDWLPVSPQLTENHIKEFPISISGLRSLRGLFVSLWTRRFCGERASPRPTHTRSLSWIRISCHLYHVKLINFKDWQRFRCEPNKDRTALAIFSRLLNSWLTINLMFFQSKSLHLFLFKNYSYGDWGWRWCPGVNFLILWIWLL